MARAFMEPPTEVSSGPGKIEIETIGGPFDRVTAILEEFLPGQPEFVVRPECFGVLRREVRRFDIRSLEVLIPSRIHATVLDMNRFSTGKCGGGGVGVAIKLYNRCRITSTKDPHVTVVGDRPQLALHFALVFKEILGYAGGFEIELADQGRRHVGLGSSTGSICAISVAINEVLGRPFTNRELRRIVGYNFCEESPRQSEYLIRAFETGLGSMVGIHGGWIVASDDLELVHRVALPDTKVVIFIPDVPSLRTEYDGKTTAAQSEAELLLRRARYLDARQGYEKAYWVLLDLIPAMIRGDLEAMGRAMLDISFIGSKRAECELHGLEGASIFHWLGLFRELGAELVGLSSVGPAVAALTRRQETCDRILAHLHESNVSESRIILTEVDNVGARIIENGVERTYQSEGWADG